MKSNLAKLFVACLVVVFLTATFKPIPVPAREECLVTTGVVTGIREAGTKDVVFSLEGNHRTYYINRGLEHLNLHELRERLVGQTITIRYPSYWTPLDPVNVQRHVSELTHQGKTVFTEIVR